MAHLNQPEPVVEEEVPEKKVKAEGEESGEEEQEEEPAAAQEEEEEEQKNKKPVAQPPVAPTLNGRPEPSTRDTMIELHTKALLQTSSTILAVSCFNSKQVLICNVDIKTRNRTIKDKIENH